MAGRGWPRAVVFDLDGTLVDSAPDIARALTRALEPRGLGPYDVPTVHRFLGDGAETAIARALAEAGIALPEGERADLLADYIGHYKTVSEEGNGRYPGAIELLEGLRTDGISCALCTNKAIEVTHVALRALGLTKHFDAVVGAESSRPRKPDAAPLLAALSPLGVAPADAVMVGDSAADVGAARAAGCRVIAVSFGYSKTPPHQLGADAVVDRLLDVASVMKGWAG